MEIANIHQAKAQLSRLIELALAGEDVQIARSGEPLVRLVPVQPDSRPRQGGQLRGKVRVAEDFDAPAPEIEGLFPGEGS
ncbi:MAG: type II toxin-antitoxin system prevent-host-death family antitoxin [Isosphaeraceae bacterium]|nr:type II toxin-antitoxin system prevent-host-death family antitoxin [Isosphaeraceae bacterium]